jgi:hypothetical protein
MERDIFYLVLGSNRVSFNDLLLWHVFKVRSMTSIHKRSRNLWKSTQTLEGCTDFDLVIDLTKCNSAQAPRVAFLERFLDLCPKSLFNRVKTVVLFQPNIESPRLLMNVHMLLRVLGKHVFSTGDVCELFNYRFSQVLRTIFQLLLLIAPVSL